MRRDYLTIARLQAISNTLNKSLTLPKTLLKIRCVVHCCLLPSLYISNRLVFSEMVSSQLEKDKLNPNLNIHPNTQQTPQVGGSPIDSVDYNLQRIP
jgi:hypothetical protein